MMTKFCVLVVCFMSLAMDKAYFAKSEISESERVKTHRKAGAKKKTADKKKKKLEKAKKQEQKQEAVCEVLIYSSAVGLFKEEIFETEQPRALLAAQLEHYEPKTSYHFVVVIP